MTLWNVNLRQISLILNGFTHAPSSDLAVGAGKPRMIYGVFMSCVGVDSGGRVYIIYIVSTNHFFRHGIEKFLRKPSFSACIDRFMFLFACVKCIMFLFAYIGRFMFLFADVSPQVNGVLVPGAKKDNFELELKVQTECG